MNDRELILERIRAASADVPATEPSSWTPERDPDPAAAYIRNLELDPEQLIATFVEHCADYRATVHRCGGQDAEIGALVAQICRRQQASSLAAPADVPPAWLPEEVEVTVDTDGALSTDKIDACDGVITGSAVSIASTGTIVLDAGTAQGRRLLTLIPDLHICVVRTEQIVAGVPEAMVALRASITAGAPITFISGPSATSDIELSRVEGVHGPRRLEVIVAG